MAESKNLLDTVKRLHFVGIGGSGMCPMAEILHHKGYVITGSDINESDTLERIRGYGIPVSMGHRAENIGDAELVVYTAAAKQDNPELVAARSACSQRSFRTPSPSPARTARRPRPACSRRS